MSRFCRLGARSAHEKSLLLLGLISDKFAQRMHGFGQAGGARGIRTHDTDLSPARRRQTENKAMFSGRWVSFCNKLSASALISVLTKPILS
jgi:hypothetical protein